MSLCRRSRQHSFILSYLPMATKLIFLLLFFLSYYQLEKSINLHYYFAWQFFAWRSEVLTVLVPLQPGACLLNAVIASAVCVVLHWLHNRFSQSRKRLLLRPSPGWKGLLALLHLRHYAQQECRHNYHEGFKKGYVVGAFSVIVKTD